MELEQGYSSYYMYIYSCTFSTFSLPCILLSVSLSLVSLSVTMAVASKMKVGDNDIANAKGICRVLDKSRPDYPEENEIEDDVEGERETWGDTYNHDDDGDMQMDPSISADDRDYLDVIWDASKGVKEGTNDAYQGYSQPFSLHYYCANQAVSY